MLVQILCSSPAKDEHHFEGGGYDLVKLLRLLTILVFQYRFLHLCCELNLIESILATAALMLLIRLHVRHDFGYAGICRKPNKAGWLRLASTV